MSLDWREIVLVVVGLICVLRFPALSTLALMTPGLLDVGRMLKSKPLGQVTTFEWFEVGSVIVVGAVFYLVVKLVRGDIELAPDVDDDRRESPLARQAREDQERSAFRQQQERFRRRY